MWIFYQWPMFESVLFFLSDFKSSISIFFLRYIHLSLELSYQWMLQPTEPLEFCFDFGCSSYLAILSWWENSKFLVGRNIH